MAGSGNSSVPTMKMIQHIPVTVAWVMLAVKIIFFLLIVVGNSLVIAVFCRSKRIRSVPYNMFILALAIVDLMTGLMLIPGDVYKNVVPNLMPPDDPIPAHFKDKTLCLAGMLSINQLLTWSSTTLMVIAGDRLIATLWPLKYHSIVTRGRAIAVLLFWWVITSIPMYVATAHTDLVFYKPDMPCMLPYQYHPILKLTVIILWGTAQLVVCYLLYLIIGLAICCGRTQVSNQKRITVMMATLLIVFTICSVPIMVMNMIQIDLPFMDRMTLAFIFFGLMHANSFCNPIIYNVTNKTFRAEFRAMCGRRSVDLKDSDDECTTYNPQSANMSTTTLGKIKL